MAFLMWFANGFDRLFGKPQDVRECPVCTNAIIPTPGSEKDSYVLSCTACGGKSTVKVKPSGRCVGAPSHSGTAA